MSEEYDVEPFSWFDLVLPVAWNTGSGAEQWEHVECPDESIIQVRFQHDVTGRYVKVAFVSQHNAAGEWVSLYMEKFTYGALLPCVKLFTPRDRSLAEVCTVWYCAQIAGILNDRSDIKDLVQSPSRVAEIVEGLLSWLHTRGSSLAAVVSSTIESFDTVEESVWDHTHLLGIGMPNGRRPSTWDKLVGTPLRTIWDTLTLDRDHRGPLMGSYACVEDAWEDASVNLSEWVRWAPIREEVEARDYCKDLPRQTSASTLSTLDRENTSGFMEDHPFTSVFINGLYGPLVWWPNYQTVTVEAPRLERGVYLSRQVSESIHINPPWAYVTLARLLL